MWLSCNLISLIELVLDYEALSRRLEALDGRLTTQLQRQAVLEVRYRTGQGTLFVTPVEQDRYGRTVAEIFVPLANTDEEISLVGQMVLDGYAYHYARYSGGCPNGHLLAGLEEQARSRSAGVWANPSAVKPWDYRR